LLSSALSHVINPRHPPVAQFRYRVNRHGARGARVLHDRINVLEMLVSEPEIPPAFYDIERPYRKAAFEYQFIHTPQPVFHLCKDLISVSLACKVMSPLQDLLDMQNGPQITPTVNINPDLSHKILGIQ
jgi:Limonene-1,2-epoxide hydrolase